MSKKGEQGEEGDEDEQRRRVDFPRQVGPQRSTQRLLPSIESTRIRR